MESTEDAPHLLFCAFASVPGPTAVGKRFKQLIAAFSDGYVVDAITTKGPKQAHIERVGTARMMRVPIDGKPFFEQMAAYKRAIARQLNSDTYALVYAGDVFSAAVMAEHKEEKGFQLFLEISDMPATSLDKRWPVTAERKLKTEWRATENVAIGAADRVIVSSRHAARILTDRVDGRRLHVLERAVDRSAFSPPTVELDLDRQQTVLVIGGHHGSREQVAAVACLQALRERFPPYDVRLVFAGQREPDDEKLQKKLEIVGLAESVERVNLDAPTRLANLLGEADVAVVLSSAESALPPWAVPHRALEAMACRRATVLTGPVDAFRELIAPGVDAVIVPEGNFAMIGEEVAALLGDDVRRKAMASAGYKKVEAEADLLARLDDFAALMTDAVGVPMTPRAPDAADYTSEATGVGDVDEITNSGAVTDGDKTAPPPSSATGDEALGGPDSVPRAPKGPEPPETSQESEGRPAAPRGKPLRTGLFSSEIVRSSHSEESLPSGWDSDSSAEGLLPPPSLPSEPPVRRPDPTRSADLKALEMLERERTRAINPAGPRTTAVQSEPGATSTAAPYPLNLGPNGMAALDGATMPGARIADPEAPGGARPSALDEETMGGSEEAADPWAPDTIFDARPVFASQDTQNEPKSDPSNAQKSEPEFDRRDTERITAAPIERPAAVDTERASTGSSSAAPSLLVDERGAGEMTVEEKRASSIASGES